MILYYICYPLLWLISWLPLGVLFTLSDAACFIIYKVVRYRVKVVRKQLIDSFPNKSLKEIKELEHMFYHHLCDYGFETIWYMNCTEKEIKEHFKFSNLEVFNEIAEQNRDTIAVFGHYANWEWVSSITLWIKNDIPVATLYRPLKNKWFDKMFIDIRSKFKTICVPKNNILRYLFNQRKISNSNITAFIADQTPSIKQLNYWSSFLNQRTPMLTGWAAIAIKRNDPVVFLDVKKVKRGYYEASIEMLCDQTKELNEHELVELYTRRMEQNILINPAYYLWSHKRWKHKHLDPTLQVNANNK